MTNKGISSEESKKQLIVLVYSVILPLLRNALTMGRPKIDNKKETKSFRVDPRLWKLVQAEAESSGKRTTDIINESLARHLGGVIRSKAGLSNEKLIGLLTRLDAVSEELGQMKGDLSHYEPKSRKRSA